ncbi:MAG: helix-turn-helix domain-containing protein [Candidatus Omnitrophota bacterium]
MDRNMVAKELARLIGADEITVLNWEVRNMTPVYKFARKIREITGLEVTSGFRDQRKFKPEQGSPGEKLRQKRLKLGFSQKEMAKKLGISVDYIADLETGRTKGSTSGCFYRNIVKLRAQETLTTGERNWLVSQYYFDELKPRSRRI